MYKSIFDIAACERNDHVRHRFHIVLFVDLGQLGELIRISRFLLHVVLFQQTDLFAIVLRETFLPEANQLQITGALHIQQRDLLTIVREARCCLTATQLKVNFRFTATKGERCFKRCIPRQSSYFRYFIFS